ncbi:hypothetical protein BN1051_02383 [Arthrobacter saudimassiliensis]|uniref:Uncharacterized protein n=1 Tax=Arthrobacter saudimassiliensis TaxID=1461584 RepID=A0A078MRX2_9MICC|nr:hypothetical protein BN1051_02383 [Arthrobacter saudimassiliensis]
METEEPQAPGQGPDRWMLRRPTAAQAARIAVPTLLGLAGFVAVAGAVASTGGTLAVTLPATAILAVLLASAGAAPFALPTLARMPWWKPAAGIIAAAVLLLVLHLAAGHVVLFTLPAAPVAVAGGALLLSTSLWGQFRRGPAPEPVIVPARELSSRPYAGTLLTVLANWILFLAAGAVTAGFLLNR